MTGLGLWLSVGGVLSDLDCDRGIGRRSRSGGLSGGGPEEGWVFGSVGVWRLWWIGCRSGRDG